MPIRPLRDVVVGTGGDRSKGRPRFAIRPPLTSIVHLLPFPRYGELKIDRKQFRPEDDVTGPIRLRHSIEGHRLSIGWPLTRNVHLAPFARYRRLKFDRKRFRPNGDVTSQIRLRRSIEGHRFSIGCPLTRNVYLASLPRYGGRKIVP